MAAALVRSLARELSGTGDGVNTLRFANRAALLARFLADRVDGTGDRWYYRRFDGLRHLPLGAALRTAIVRDTTVGLAALQTLDPDRERPAVLEALTAQDAALVLDAFAAGPAARSIAACCRTAVQYLSSAGAERATARATLALTLFVGACDSEHGGGPLRAAVDLVSRVVVVARGLDAESRGRMAAGLACGDLSAIAGLAPHLATLIAPLDAETTTALAEAATHTDVRTAPPSLEPERQWTRFGGAFLLLPDVDALPPLDVAADGLDRRCASFVILALCLAPSMPEAVLGDAAIAGIFDLSSHVSPSAMWHSASAGEREQLVAAADSVLAAFAHRLPGFAQSGAGYLRRTFLDVPASVDRESDRIVVRVSRPPLHVMLSVAGLLRRRYELSWLDVPIEVFPED